MNSVISSTKWILLIVAILLFLLLGFGNMGTYTALMLFPGIEIEQFPLSMALILSFAFAFITFFIVGILDQLDSYFTERELRRKIRDLENEVSQLRNLPIRENLKSQRTVEEENR